MRIVTQGTDPDTVPVQGTCNHCKTTVEFLPHEAKRHSDQRDGDAYEVQCPTCKRQIWTAVYRGGNGYFDR